ncbi:MAG: class I SAM-dependent methyltransferase [Myxococcota bacterium]
MNNAPRATDYNVGAETYGEMRRADPRIATEIRAALGDVHTVINVGAGAGSYEPTDLDVTPVEPAQVLAAQHPNRERVVSARAERLPFPDDSFDAALAILTVHHWRDRMLGLSELRRVAKQRVVVVTWDPHGPEFWLTRDYFPDMRTLDEQIFPSLNRGFAALGTLRVTELHVPHDCSDGFSGAYWRRPEAYLSPKVRSAISSFGKLNDVDVRVELLRTDLDSGRWHERNRSLLPLDALDLGYRIVVSSEKPTNT